MYELVTHCLHNKRSTTQKTLLQLGKQDSIWGSKAVIWDCRGNHKSIDTIPQDAAHTRENPRENKQGGAHNCLWSHASRRIVLLWYYFKWSVTVVEYNIWRFFLFIIFFFYFQKTWCHVNWLWLFDVCYVKTVTNLDFFLHKWAWSSASIICHL